LPCFLDLMVSKYALKVKTFLITTKNIF